MELRFRPCSPDKWKEPAFHISSFYAQGPIGINPSGINRVNAELSAIQTLNRKFQGLPSIQYLEAVGMSHNILCCSGLNFCLRLCLLLYHVYMCILVRVSISVLKHHGQNQDEDERVYLFMACSPSSRVVKTGT